MKKFTLLMVMVLFPWVCPRGAAQPHLVSDSCYSIALGRPVHINVLLPSQYTPSRRYPVLYLLHGWNGNYRNWMELTDLATFASRFPMIIVMPDGENSWYVNSATEPHARFEDLIVSDVPRYLRKRYSVDTSWQGIAGLSMGGYGALQIGLRHYDRFRFIGVMSGGLDVPSEIDSMEKRGRSNLLPSVLTAFGAKKTSFHDEHDPFLLCRLIPPDSCPYIYLVTGTQELFRGRLLIHRRFADTLRARGISYEYHERPGGHNFSFWDREIGPLLRRFDELRAAAVIPSPGSPGRK